MRKHLKKHLRRKRQCINTFRLRMPRTSTLKIMRLDILIYIYLVKLINMNQVRLVLELGLFFTPITSSIGI
jgi:hypothetical protein